VLRALREARGVTLAGWGARLGVSRTTVQRWERGERAPDPGAESAILAYCREADLFRAYDRGPLAGLALTPELLRDLLAEARWRISAKPTDALVSGASSVAPPTIAAVPGGAWPSPSNLPAHLTTFVGREHEIAAVRRVQAGTRLLTLTGPGGCGKTRLALELARELLWAYSHGICLVELAALAEPALVPDTVAAALGVRPTGSRPPAEDVREFLEGRHLLLVLDNCEHLLPACAHFAEALLRASPTLEVIATSREPLGIAGETVWRVPPMALSDGVKLFVDRARLHRPDFAVTPANAEAVSEVCARLDGIPLAIELATARLNMLTPEQIAARLGDRLGLLVGGSRTALPRHQTLRATLDWSYDLLAEPEQALLCGLAVFAGGFTLDAADALGEDVFNTLSQLVDKSLVISEERDGGIRCRMLETVRQYAAEHLEQRPDAATMRERHLAWCLSLARGAEDAYRGPHEPAWLRQLDQEHDNLRAALSWALAHHQGEAALRLAAALPRFWMLRGHLFEGRRWLTLALETATDPPAALRAEALHGTGILAYMQGDYAAARALFEESLGLYQARGQARGIAEAQGNLGRAALRQGDFPAARTFLEASLALHAGQAHAPGIANGQFTLGVLALRQGDYAQARAYFEASLVLQRELRDTEGTANALEELATVAGEQGDYPRQVLLLEESLALYRELGHRGGIGAVLGNLGVAAWAQGDPARGARLMDEGLALYREVGDRRGVARLLGNQAYIAVSAADYASGAALSRASLRLYREVGDAWALIRYLPVLAGATFGLGQPEQAARLFGAAAALREQLGTRLPPIVQSTHDRAVAAVAEVLGPAPFAAAWAAGQTLTLDAATDEALAEVALAPATATIGKIFVTE